MIRKLYHISGLVFPALMYIFSKEVAVYAAAVFFGCIFLFDLTRQLNTKFNLWAFGTIKFMVKPKEFHSFSGSTYFSGGVLATLLIFKPDIATAGIIILSLGDSAAVTIGERWGKISLWDKTLEGTAAFVGAAFIALSLLNIIGFFEFNYSALFISSLICAFIEAVPMKIDDNFVLPIIGAALIALLG